VDNELHSIENSKKRILVVDDYPDRATLATLLSAYECVDHLTHLYRPPFYAGSRLFKEPPQPPSKKPLELRTEHDYERLSDAEERRKKRNAKRLINRK
jgi:hypothetical protein